VLDAIPHPPLIGNELLSRRSAHDAIGFNALRVKRSLILVSRTWRSLAVEFLYEFVRLQSPAELLSLIQSLCRNESGQITKAPNRQLCWYIRSLWLSTGQSFTALEGRPEKEEVVEALRTLFDICHDLRILRVWPGRFLMDFPEISNPLTSLRSAEITWTYTNGIPTFGQSLATKQPRADVREVLVLDLDDLWRNQRDLPGHPLSLPQVHSLQLTLSVTMQLEWSVEALQLLASWDLPNCRFLSLIASQPTWSPQLEGFLRAFGPKIGSLELVYPQALPIAAIVGYCSSIRDLYMFYMTRDTPDQRLPVTPHLRRIEFTGGVEARHALKWVEEIYIKGQPSLRCIQFRTMPGAAFLAQLDDVDQTRWREWGEKLLAEDIRVEDKHGELVCRATDRMQALSSVEMDVKERDVFLMLRERLLYEKIRRR
jgi:hypothetical protein